MEDLAGKNILVLGLGRSGRSAAAYCAKQGARVLAVDEQPSESNHPELEGLAVVRSGIPFPSGAAFDLVIPSPGIPQEKIPADSVCVWGDIELAYRTTDVPFIAVTGTNGKSTTTCLIEAMLTEAGIKTAAAGNIGIPILDVIDPSLEQVVVEVSSFQLETTETFKPAIAVLLNITPDHLDRHGSVDSYISAKARVFAHQGKDDLLIANAGDPRVRELARSAPGRVWTFHLSEPQEQGAWLDGDDIVMRIDGREWRTVYEAEFLTGVHNAENALASLLAAHAAGVPFDQSLNALQHFRGLPHRTELVRCLSGVRYIDDSKATNVGAAVRALESFDTPVVWIAGGKDKGLDFRPLGAACANVRTVILMGEAGPQLEAALPLAVPRVMVANLDSAVIQAARLAEPNDVVLLAPACASFDQFANFEERGERFRAAVEALPEPGVSQLKAVRGGASS
ncbi:MAG: UDP-N-acetylmuramoyl-L-alanine--D-glutamate ligase [Deltaproteobacteria bacterium]|nr:UDP-N-acetylmuramoyl-L-alanine--D-glutamate ligase [Deltaproteobacteria bacterium]